MRVFQILPFLAALLHALAAAAAPGYEPIGALERGPSHPERAKLFRHADGFLYGASRYGGAYNTGVIYRVRTDGRFATVAHFPVVSGVHKGGLASDGRGFLWGTTCSIGTPGRGTIYEYEPATGAFRTVMEFADADAAEMGRFPFAGLTLDTRGFLWGTTMRGGAADAGTVFKLDPLTGTFTSVAYFTNRDGDAAGNAPLGVMVSDGAGFVWGTTSQGGANDIGTIFKVNTLTGALTTVASFDWTIGAYPESDLAADGLGFLWGAAAAGGSTVSGTVFKVRIATGELTKVHDLTGFDGAAPGRRPTAGLARDRAGFLWGSTSGGGAENGGTLFKIHPGTGAFTLVKEFAFLPTGRDGFAPDSTLVLDGAGKLWAAMPHGGFADSGAILRVDPVTGRVATVQRFTGSADGLAPILARAGLCEGMGGVLWGTAAGGGANGLGSVYLLNPAAGRLRTIHSFTGAGGSVRGSFPEGRLRHGGDGFLWGTTTGGGARDSGTVFKINAQTGAFASVAEFGGPTAAPGIANGRTPGDVLRDGLGFLWGTTAGGGVSGRGTIFKVHGQTGRLVTMINFTGEQGAAIGTRPNGGLCPDDAGFSWGTTSSGGAGGKGTIFKVNTRTGAFTSVASFTGRAGAIPGSHPAAGMARDGAGYLWGTTSGEEDFPGTIFKVNPASGLFTPVFQFPVVPGGFSFGKWQSGLVSDGAGSLWGAAPSNGTLGPGILFKITTGGIFREVFAFTGPGGFVPGYGPVFDSLLRHSDGNLYGVTSSGGIKADGSPAGGSQIFRIRLDGAPAPR